MAPSWNAVRHEHHRRHHRRRRSLTRTRPTGSRTPRNRIRLLVGTINDSITKLHDLVQEAKNSGAHVALGFPSWTAYLADVFTVDVRLERGARAELVSYLSGEGMSQHAIADVIGVSQKTVDRDLDATESNDSVDPDRKTMGKDGKERRQPKRKPKPEPVAPEPEPEPVSGADPADLKALMDTVDLLGKAVDAFDKAWSAWDNRPMPEREANAVAAAITRTNALSSMWFNIPTEVYAGMLAVVAEREGRTT